MPQARSAKSMHLNLLRGSRHSTYAGTPGNEEGAVADRTDRKSRANGNTVRPRSRDLRAARLGAIKDDILNHLRQPALSIHATASRHGISARYISQLFAADGTSFSEFVLQQRLAAVHLMLSDMRFTNRTIGAIAFEAGFGDLSEFDHAFERRYGVKPAEVLEAVRSRGNQ